MKCACCGKKKGIFESFEDIGEGISICSDCSVILYRIPDAVMDNNKTEYDNNVLRIKNNIKCMSSSSEFKKWFNENFMKRDRNVFKEG